MSRTLFLGTLALLTLAPPRAPAGHHPYHLQMVDCWYRHYLNRPLDCLGAGVWCPQIQCGTSTDKVLARILGSEEYFCRHGHTNCGFITGLYCQMVGRPPCPAEVHHWSCRLGACGCRAKLAEAFLCAFRKGILGGTPTLPAPNHPPAPPPLLVPPTVPALPAPRVVPPGAGYYPPVPGYGPPANPMPSP